MSLPAVTYDLVLILDPQADETARAKVVADTRATIEAQGELLRHDDWGERPLAYPIERRATGEYHLLQFHPGSVELLNGLERTLHITDDVLRFRIVKLRPGVPEAPDMGTAAPAARRPDGAAEPATEGVEAPEQAPADLAAEPA